jgi:hypothetical protein
MIMEWNKERSNLSVKLLIKDNCKYVQKKQKLFKVPDVVVNVGSPTD